MRLAFWHAFAAASPSKPPHARFQQTRQLEGSRRSRICLERSRSYNTSRRRSIHHLRRTGQKDPRPVEKILTRRQQRMSSPCHESWPPTASRVAYPKLWLPGGVWLAGEPRRCGGARRLDFAHRPSVQSNANKKHLREKRGRNDVQTR